MARSGFFFSIEPPANPQGFSPGLLARLTGKRPGPRRYKDWDGTTVEEYRADVLKPVLQSLLQDIREKLGDDVGNRSIWEYLDIDPVYYSLTQKNGQWIAGFVFSSCAGMADVSMEVANHWLDRHAHAYPQDFRQRLQEQGLALEQYPLVPEENGMEEPCFLPFENYGYALKVEPMPETDLRTLNEETLWDQEFLIFDQAGIEDDPEFSQRLLSFIKRGQLETLPPGCHCGYCDPGFQPLKLE